MFLFLLLTVPKVFLFSVHSLIDIMNAPTFAWKTSPLLFLIPVLTCLGMQTILIGAIPATYPQLESPPQVHIGLDSQVLLSWTR